MGDYAQVEYGAVADCHMDTWESAVHQQGATNGNGVLPLPDPTVGPYFYTWDILMSSFLLLYVRCKTWLLHQLNGLRSYNVELKPDGSQERILGPHIYLLDHTLV